MSFGGMHRSSSCNFFSKGRGSAKGSIVFTSMTALNEDRCLATRCFTPSCFACLIVSRFRRTIASRCRQVIGCFGPRFVLKLATAPREVSKGSVCRVYSCGIPCRVALGRTVGGKTLIPFRCCNVCSRASCSALGLMGNECGRGSLGSGCVNGMGQCSLVCGCCGGCRSGHTLNFYDSEVRTRRVTGRFYEENVGTITICDGTSKRFSGREGTTVRRLGGRRVGIVFSMSVFGRNISVTSLSVIVFLEPARSPAIFLRRLNHNLHVDGNGRCIGMLSFVKGCRGTKHTPFLLGKNTYIKREATCSCSRVRCPSSYVISFSVHLVSLFQRVSGGSLSVGREVGRRCCHMGRLLSKGIPAQVRLFAGVSSRVCRCYVGRSGRGPFGQCVRFLCRVRRLSSRRLRICGKVKGRFLGLVRAASVRGMCGVPVLCNFCGSNGMEVTMASRRIIRD